MADKPDPDDKVIEGLFDPNDRAFQADMLQICQELEDLKAEYRDTRHRTALSTAQRAIHILIAGAIRRK